MWYSAFLLPFLNGQAALACVHICVSVCVPCVMPCSMKITWCNSYSAQCFSSAFFRPLACLHSATTHKNRCGGYARTHTHIHTRARRFVTDYKARHSSRCGTHTANYRHASTHTHTHTMRYVRSLPVHAWATYGARVPMQTKIAMHSKRSLCVCVCVCVCVCMHRGISTVVLLMAYYALPLSSLGTVIKTRNSASIYMPLAVSAVLNGTTW